VTIIQRQLTVFIAVSQTEASCRALESSQADFQNHICQAAAHLAQAKLCLGRAMRTEPGTRIKTRRVLETVAAIGQAAIEAVQAASR